jgi:hypothetical protein
MTHDYILLSQNLRLPTPGRPVPCIYIPQEEGGAVKNRVELVCESFS